MKVIYAIGFRGKEYPLELYNKVAYAKKSDAEAYLSKVLCTGEDRREFCYIIPIEVKE